MPDDNMPKFPSDLDLSNFPRTVAQMGEVVDDSPRRRPAKRFYAAGIGAGVVLLIGLLIASSFVH